MALPFSLGYRRNNNLWKDGFHKSQHCDYNTNGVPIVDLEKPGIGGELLLGQKIPPKYFVYPKGEGRNEPSWVAFDKQVLTFDAYFEERVPGEPYRIRKVKIYFYPEDDTIKVVEPKQKNSGIRQGTLISRHRIPLPPPNDERFYNVHHFNISQEMVLYSRTFTVTDCDPYTRKFLTKLGVRLNAPTSVPQDPYNNLREQMMKNMKPLRPYEKLDKLKQFLDHDGKVLRFYCFWDDSVFKQPYELVLHYFLADDTIEIREVMYPYGMGNTAKFLHRSKLPKRTPITKQPGEVTDRTVLNIIGPRGRYIYDRLNTGALHDEFYKDCDLTIGGEVNVCGRRVVIYDCDDFTKDYLRNKYGIEDFTPVQYKPSTSCWPTNPVPPYNGFGTEEDSLRSCQTVVPRPPKDEFYKLLARTGMEREALRFHAKMESANPNDEEREFVICFYLYDDTIAVFEERKSGMVGGQFLERVRVKKPGQELFKRGMSEYFSAQDLYVGALVNLNSHLFQLVDADEYTFGYMEQHAEEFPKANMATIRRKARSLTKEKQAEIRHSLASSDWANSGIIPFKPFRDLLVDMECGLTEHEVTTLGRSFIASKNPESDVGLLLAVAQHYLKKKSFENFPEMTRVFMHQDRQRTGRLSTKETWRIFKTFPLPLVEDLLRAVLDKFTESEEIDYPAFLKGINWMENPAPQVLIDDILKLYGRDWKLKDQAVRRHVNLGALDEEVFSTSL